MKNTPQLGKWSSRMRLPGATAVLALATVLVSAFITTQPAQAQTVKILHSFDNTDGNSPQAGLIQATNGSLYGTTEGGGEFGGGTIFKIAPSGTLTSLHSFTGSGTEGSSPFAGLVQATNGNLYGTTSNGGIDGLGTVFKITASGTLTILHNFDNTDGNSPQAGLIQATDGNLYGTTGGGGAHGFGTIFRISPSGTLKTLYSFAGSPADGATPNGTLVEDTSGKLYGTTASGGANDFGTVFSLSVGLSPFVKTLPTSGKVGAAVKILGTNLTGASGVTFNGTAATFTIVSKSEITTTVPTGATTGTVEVTTPSGTLKSNPEFLVTP